MVAITEQDAVCRLTREGAVVLECPVAFDPQRALDLLRQINMLQATDGTPIHARHREGSTPLWAMLQEHLFWE